MKPIGRTDLRSFLRTLRKEQLINQIIDLSESFPEVRDYYQAKVRPADDAAVREKYARIVEREFFPARGLGRLRLSVARKAVTDYRKVAASVDGIADLMLFYVEVGIRFVNTYGDIDAPFYGTMERMYARALQWISRHGLEERFRGRCERIVEETSDIGWGLHDGVVRAFRKHFDTPRA